MKQGISKPEVERLKPQNLLHKNKDNQVENPKPKTIQGAPYRSDEFSIMNIIETTIPGCFEIHPDVLKDERGTFVKTFHQDIFDKHGLTTAFAEEYYSYSNKGVLRGFHFQLPPHDHIKMVYCVSGTIMDAIIDLRKGSPTYGQHAVFELSGEKANTLYLGKGIAHAFYVMSDFAIVMYKVTTVYAPEHDAGILWNSADVPWPDEMPVLSVRDKSFPPLGQFESPFVYADRKDD